MCQAPKGLRAVTIKIDSYLLKMEKTLASNTKKEIRNLIYDFFSDECDVDKKDITDHTNIIEELDGDSLMLLALMEKVCKKFGLTIELKKLAKHLMKKPADTIGEVITLTNTIIEHGDNILDVDV